MAIYAMSDLHLYLGINKPMEVFGERWENYIERIQENWKATVEEDDLVLIPGDISWATYLPQAAADFDFINRLPGKKIILKGNHDYYWTTQAKLTEYLEVNGFSTISFLHNNSYLYKNTAICGTRGWAKETPDEAKDDAKLTNRENERLKISLESALKTDFEKIIVCFHYPVEYGSVFWATLARYPVSRVIYGHLHNVPLTEQRHRVYDGIEVDLVSCDYLQFKPLLLEDN